MELGCVGGLGFKVKSEKGYGIFTVSKENVELIKSYIQNQERHHRDVKVENSWGIE